MSSSVRLRRAARVAALALPALLGATCKGGEDRLGPTGGVRVLFIGNSLTQENDLPAMVKELASATGQRFSYGTVLVGGFGLVEHWEAGDAQNAIARRGWDVVVLQQGPSGLPESRVLLIDYTRRFDALIKRAGARTALYMVWPEAWRPAAFDSVSDNYRAAAEAVHGDLYPVGDAWRAAWRLDPSMPLYSEDQFHPSPTGTYLAALVFYAKLFDRSPVGLPARVTVNGAPFEIPADQADILQQAAAEVTAANGPTVRRQGSGR